MLFFAGRSLHKNFWLSQYLIKISHRIHAEYLLKKSDVFLKIYFEIIDFILNFLYSINEIEVYNWLFNSEKYLNDKTSLYSLYGLIGELFQ